MTPMASPIRSHAGQGAHPTQLVLSTSTAPSRSLLLCLSLVARHAPCFSPVTSTRLVLL